MIYVAAGASVLVVAIATLVTRLRHLSTTFALRQPEPFVFAHIRVLRDDHEVREVAHHACDQPMAWSRDSRRLTNEHDPT